MSSDDVERLYQMMREVERRLIHIEKELAERRGADDARQMSKAQIATWAGVIIAGVSVCTTVLLRIVDLI